VDCGSSELISSISTDSACKWKLNNNQRSILKVWSTTDSMVQERARSFGSKASKFLGGQINSNKLLYAQVAGWIWNTLFIQTKKIVSRTEELQSLKGKTSDFNRHQIMSDPNLGVVGRIHQSIDGSRSSETPMEKGLRGWSQVLLGRYWYPSSTTVHLANTPDVIHKVRSPCQICISLSGIGWTNAWFRSTK
jgi:hypothetical protein